MDNFEFTTIGFRKLYPPIIIQEIAKRPSLYTYPRRVKEEKLFSQEFQDQREIPGADF